MQKQFFSGIALTAAVALTAAELLPNGSFEKIDQKSGFAAGWGAGKYMGAEGAAVIDQENPASGKHSVRLVQTGGKGFIGVASNINLPKPLAEARKLSISVRVCGDKLKGGQFVIFAGDKEKPQRQWLSIFSFDGSFEWKTFKKDVEILPGATRITISIRAGRPGGTLWIDDVSAKWQAPAAASGVELVSDPEFAGTVSSATGLPAGWSLKMFDGMEAAGDVKVAKSGFQSPTSLLLRYLSGARRFGAQTDLKNIPQGASEFSVSAQVRCEKDGEARMMAEFFDAAGRAIGSSESPASSSEEWKELKWNFSTPPECSAMKLYSLSTGTGAVFFDRVSCRRIGNAKVIAPVLEAKALPLDGTRVWNDGKAVFHSFAEGPLPVAFHFKGQRGRLKAPAFEIDLPAGLHISDSFSTHASFYGYENPVVTKITRPEGEYRRCRFENIRTFKILQPGFGWERKLAVVIAPDRPAEAVGKNFKVFHRVADGPSAGAEESFDLKFLAAPQGRKPKNFRIMRWGIDDFFFTKDAPFLAASAMQEACGMTTFTRQSEKFPRGAELVKLLEKRNGWNFTLGCADYLYVKFLAPSSADYKALKVEFIKRADDKVNTKKLCPQYFIEDPAFVSYFKEYFRRSIAGRNPRKGDWIKLDHEPWDTMEWCYCPRCLKAFVKFAGLTSTPTVAEVKKKHAEKWAEFRCRQTTDTIRICREVTDRHFPGVLLADYDYVVDFGSPKEEAVYRSVAKNPKLNEKYFDLHLTSYYHYIDHAAFDMIRKGTRTLEKPYIPVCAIDGVGYLSAAEVMNPKQARQMAVASAALGSPGFAIYPGIHIDGGFYVEFARANDEIAAMEEFYANGKQDAPGTTLAPRFLQVRKITVNGKAQELRFPRWQGQYAMASAKKGDEIGVTVFNYHRETPLFADLTFDLPAGNYTVLNPVSGRRIPPHGSDGSWSAAALKKGVPVLIPPQEIGYFVVRGSRNADSGLAVEYRADDVEKKFRHAVKNFGSGSEIKTLREGKLALFPMDSDNDGVPEIALESPGQQLHVDAVSGAVKNWSVGGKALAGKFSNDRFWLPQKARGDFDGKASAPSVRIEKGVAEVKIARRIRTLPLTVEKSVRVREGKAGFEVEYLVSNSGGAPVEFSLWSNHTTKDGATGFSAEGVPATDGSFVYPLKKGIHQGFPASAVTGIFPGDSSVVKFDGRGVRFRPGEGGVPMQFYFWRSPSISTWEWMSPVIRIEPGKQHRIVQYFTPEQ